MEDLGDRVAPGGRQSCSAASVRSAWYRGSCQGSTHITSRPFHPFYTRSLLPSGSVSF